MTPARQITTEQLVVRIMAGTCFAAAAVLIGLGYFIARAVG